VLPMGTNFVEKRTLYLMCYDRAREYRSVDDKSRLWYRIVADVARSEIPEWTVTWCFQTCKSMGNPLGIPFPCSYIHRTGCRDSKIQILQLSVLSESRSGRGTHLENRAIFVLHFEALRLQHLWDK